MKKFLTLSMFVFAFLAALTLPARALPSDSEMNSSPPLTLEKVQANPEAFLNSKVKLTCQFVSFGKVFNPFYTRFTEDQFINLCVWDDTKNLWVKEDFKKTFSFLFVDKYNAFIKQVMTMKKFQRFDAVGIVRSTFNHVPWIEIVEFSPLKEHLTKGSLLQIAKGFQMVAEEEYDSAYLELVVFEEDETLPERIKMTVYKNLGIAAYHTSRYRKARYLLQKSYEYFPENKVIEEYLEKAIRAEGLKEMGTG